MTIPFLSQEDFIKHLQNHGCKIVSNDYFYTDNRIILEKDSEPIILQYRSIYFYPMVCKICERLKIPAPKDHKICFDQTNKMGGERGK